MSWVKGERLKLTLEITAEEPSDETGDVWFREGRGRKWLNLLDIEEAGGSFTFEKIPKPVDLPTKKWAQVIVKGITDNYLVTRCNSFGCWHDVQGKEISVEVIKRNYVRTLSEGVDE